MLYVLLLQTVTMVSAELEDLQNQYTADLQYVIVIELPKKKALAATLAPMSTGAGGMAVQTAWYR